MNLTDKAEKFMENVNLSIVFDHARAGNMFFLTLFDQHEEVLTTPALQYIYSYILTELGEKEVFDSTIAYHFATNISYLKYVCNPKNEENIEFFRKHSFSEDTDLNRDKIKEYLRLLVFKNKTISRKRLVTSIYAAYAIGANRDLEKVKYILISDAISLRMESIFKPFSAKIVELMVTDFKSPKFFHLVRDPRASFASFNHEYTNDNGNTYGLTLRNYLSQLVKLLTFDLTDRKGCVFFTTFAYFTSGSKTMNKLKSKYSELFLTIKNEDLNLDFKTTITYIVNWLGVSNYKLWFEKNYKPTALGRQFHGTGAYHNYYQKELMGPLVNDEIGVSRSVTGPNRYVTERWKKRLSPHVILLLEYIFYDELMHYGYDFIYLNKLNNYKNLLFIFISFLPITGEIPKLKWIYTGLKISRLEFLNRLLYYIYIIPYYIISRILLIKLYYSSFYRIQKINS